MNTAVSPHLEPLLHYRIQSPWEGQVREVCLSTLSRNGTLGLLKLGQALNGIMVTPGVDHTGGLVAADLTLREASNLLAVLENAEADRLVRTRAIVQELLAFALQAAEALLKAALGGLL